MHSLHPLYDEVLLKIAIVPAVTPENVKQILDAALQDGSFPLGYLKSMAIGVARSGKTLSKNHVFKITCDPNCSVSTGVCEAPILAFRQLTLELIKALPSAEGFVLLKYEDINQFLADVVRKGLLKGRVAKVVKEVVQAASEGSSSSDRSEWEPSGQYVAPNRNCYLLGSSVTYFCPRPRRVGRLLTITSTTVLCLMPHRWSILLLRILLWYSAGQETPQEAATSSQHFAQRVD